MSKRQFELSTDHYSRIPAPRALTAALFISLSVLIGALVWLSAKDLLAHPLRMHPLRIPGLFALHALLLVSLQHSLELAPLPRAWSYRLGFLGSAGLAGLGWLALSLQTGPRLSPVWLLAALGGSFLGGLVATGVDGSFWENNSPPSERTQAEVFQRHQARIASGAGIPFAKRLFDLCISLGGLAVSAPVWLLSAFLVWFEDPGPVLFVKNSVGLGGRNFHQFKFRTMVRQAEDATGPVLARVEDERVLRVGRFLRKTALDELPQLINILKGEMSFVGPRPQRTILVYGYLEKLPEYAERHRVLPGLSGLAQVAGDYYLTPRQKLRFDRLYITQAGLGYDLKLLFLAFLITFWYRWQPGWRGRLPRRLLHVKRDAWNVNSRFMHHVSL